MNRSPKIHTMLMGILMLAGCAGPSVVYNYNDSDSYADNAPYSDVDYDTSCDYYTPPWGYPADYCRYQLWSEPVYYGGVWYSGPIYSRLYGGERWYWLNGDWRHDEWRGARPSIDWSRGRNVYWKGDLHHGRNDFAGRGRPMERSVNDRRDSAPRGFDNDNRNDSPRRDGVAGDRFDNRGRDNGGRDANGRDAGGNEGGNGRFGDRGQGNGGRNNGRGNNAVMPNPGSGPGNLNAGNPPTPPNQGSGRAGDRGVGNAGGEVTNSQLPVARSPNGHFIVPGRGNAGGTVASPESRRGPANDNPGGARPSPENIRKIADTDNKPADKAEADNGNRKGNGRDGGK